MPLSISFNPQPATNNSQLTANNLQPTTHNPQPEVRLMTISKKIENIIAGSSFIRKMFEEGARLKAEYGAENVYDFSLGNPNVPPPEKFNQILQEEVAACGLNDHCYMPNTGYPMVCGSVAEYLAREQQAPVTEKDVIMTCGASGALNVALKAVLDPGDEVLTPVPCFVEYKFYADNHGGVLKTVATKPDFELDIAAVAAALNARPRKTLGWKTPAEALDEWLR